MCMCARRCTNINKINKMYPKIATVSWWIKIVSTAICLTISPQLSSSSILPQQQQQRPLPFSVTIDWADAADINTVTDSICVPNKFVNNNLCNGSVLLKTFQRQSFNFKKEADVHLYGCWLRLLNNLQFYKPQQQAKLLNLMAINNRKWATINTNGMEAALQARAAEVFRWTADTWTLCHKQVERDVFAETYSSFVNFFHTYLLWNTADELYLFKTVLYAYRNVRNYWPEVDAVAKQAVRLALDYPLSLISSDVAKKTFYVLYVNQIAPLNDNLTAFFQDCFVEINKESLMPYSFVVDAGAFSFTIHHATRDAAKIDAMRDETKFVINNTKMLFDRLKLSFAVLPPQSSTDLMKTIEIFVYKDKKTYSAMGPLWHIDTNNGGYTHINYRTDTIESHVYYENEEILPRNFGHELQHSIMYKHNKVYDSLPLWLVEGLANLIGNRPCHLYDYESMQTHLNCTVKHIVYNAVSYYNNADLVYGMGSALVAFLYEQRPQQLKNMLERTNYILNIDANMENDFAVFKHNKIFECQHKIRVAGTDYDGNSTPAAITRRSYLKAVELFKFAECGCKNYVQFNFEDVIFVMTPFKLIKVNKRNVNETINTQKEIRFNNKPIGIFDYNWFLKGVLKHTLRYFGDSLDRLRVDNHYLYNSQIVCGGLVGYKPVVSKISLDSEIALFSWRSGVWDSVEYLENKNYIQGKTFVQNYIQNWDSCRNFVAPVPLFSKLYRTLIIKANVVETLDRLFLEPFEQLVVLDARGNTIVHLLAMFNHALYKQLLETTAIADQWRPNYDAHTPQDLYKWSIKYVNFYKKMPNRHCFTFVVATDSNSYASSTETPAVSHVSDANDYNYGDDDSNENRLVLLNTVSTMYINTTVDNSSNSSSNSSSVFVVNIETKGLNLTKKINMYLDAMMFAILNHKMLKFWFLFTLFVLLVVVINIGVTHIIICCNQLRFNDKNKTKANSNRSNVIDNNNNNENNDNNLIGNSTNVNDKHNNYAVVSGVSSSGAGDNDNTLYSKVINNNRSINGYQVLYSNIKNGEDECAIRLIT
nr:hypothetical protein Caab_145 [Calliteara abietis nucleopolyhedrovirus]